MSGRCRTAADARAAQLVEDLAAHTGGGPPGGRGGVALPAARAGRGGRERGRHGQSRAAAGAVSASGDSWPSRASFAAPAAREDRILMEIRAITARPMM